MTELDHGALIADMRLALLSELGARAAYRGLARREKKEELARLLEQLWQEEKEQVERLRALMTKLGARPRKRSFRRLVAAHILVVCARLFGSRFALRVCLDAEAAVSRWYAEYSHYFAQAGMLEEGLECDALALTKRRHAQILQAWVDLLP